LNPLHIDELGRTLPQVRGTKS